jgi:GTP-binding protein
MGIDVEFLGAFAGGRLPGHGYPEIAVGGRSNVGKSSFINTVLGVRGLARVSSRPGKTTTINHYLCDKRFALVDLPGYGYSQASRTEKKRWARDVEAYLTGSADLRGLVLVVDIRHFPLPVDLEAVDWFRSFDLALLLAATKSDKLGMKHLKDKERIIAGVAERQGVDFVVFSANTGRGKSRVWEWMNRMVRS